MVKILRSAAGETAFLFNMYLFPQICVRYSLYEEDLMIGVIYELTHSDITSNLYDGGAVTPLFTHRC
jgi:hypothetical protein